MDESSNHGAPLAVSQPAPNERKLARGGCYNPFPKPGEDEIMIFSSDSEDDYIPIGSDSKEMDHETWWKYLTQIEESDGFDIEDYPGCCMATTIGPHYFEGHPTRVAELSALATKAIDEFNSENGEDYKFVKIEKANSELVAGYIYYITFQGRKADADPNDESALVTFQTRVWDPIPHPSEAIVFFCRIKEIKK